MRDDRSVMVAEQNQERREEDLLQDQRRQAEEDRARRARERMEIERQQDIQSARKAAGQCILCGIALGAFGRIFGAVRHQRCRSFTE